MANPPKSFESDTQFKATEAEINAVFQTNFQVRSLIFNYCLAAAILGCIPLWPWITELSLLVLFFLNIKMIRDVGAYWGYGKGQSLLTILLTLFGIIGAFAMALMAFMAVYVIGLLWLPIVLGWANIAAYFEFTLVLGLVANEFYLGSFTWGAKR